MKEVFINGLGYVNAQFNEAISEEIVELTDHITKAKLPSLKDVISPVMSRRMASGVKLGIYASKKALEEANVEQPDAIITGTALGCLLDSEKFLTNIIQNNEEFLTPTAFIQSTHNTVGSQVALHLGCNAYNFTYTNGFNSFENALLDGFLQIQESQEQAILVGGMDEIGERTYELQQLIGQIETDDNNGDKYSEGAHFFLISDEKKSNTYAKIKDVFIQNEYNQDELLSEFTKFIQLNNIELSDINAIISGEDNLLNDSLLNDSISIFSYKNIIGEYGTASAFGLVLGCELLKNQVLPKQFKKNHVEVGNYKTVLLVNGHKGKDLSLLLLQSI